MPVKQIQLRGISRTPSDRMTADGGCAESLNVHLEENELCPTLPPSDITDMSDDDFVDFGLLPASAGKSYDVLYIHRSLGYVHYICLYNDGIGVWKKEEEAYQFKIFFAIPDGDSFDSITSVGNTLVIATKRDMHYVLWSGAEYEYLGPTPNIDVTVYGEDITSTNGELQVDGSDTPIDRSAFERGEIKDYKSSQEAKAYIDSMWLAITKILNKPLIEGKYFFPMFFRAAIRLYDGTYIHATPFIFVPQNRKNYHNYFYHEDSPAYIIHFDGNNMCIGRQINYTLYTASRLPNSIIKYVIQTPSNLENWSDIISSVDFFCSGPMYPNTDKYYAQCAYGESPAGNLMELFPRGDDEDVMKKYIESYGQLYLCKSIPFVKLASGTTVSAIMDCNFTTEHLATQTPFIEHSSHDSLLSNLKTYNARIAGILSAQKLSTGLSYINGESYQREPLSDTTILTVLYRIKTNAGERIVFGGNRGYLHDNTYRAHTFISYPDTRCYQAEIYFSKDIDEEIHYYKRVIDMRPYPLSDCAYGFIGLLNIWQDVDAAEEIEQEDIPSWYDGIENRIEEYDNKLALSESSNPFFYPVSSRYTIQTSRILDFAAVTTALSTGQFGQFSIYVFTADGIWAMESNSIGTFTSSRLVSQDVALEKSITPIEQAIIFTTEKGVMMIAGSDIRCLSENMNGQHYVLEQQISDILEGDSDWAGFLPILQDGDPFMSFMRGARAVRDYTGDRILFFKEGEVYAYVFSTLSATWHKQAIPEGLSFDRLINSYPDAYAQFSEMVEESPVTHVLNFSVPLDLSAPFGEITSEEIRTIIVTRPFDLEATDMRKVIKDIRIRGFYNREDVQYILLASMDGHKFHRVTSLRQGSYKLYRMIILAKLNPIEKISWIDVEYETRFNNKLR